MRTRDLEPVPGEVLPAGRDISSGELRARFEHLARDPPPIARRDAAVLALLFAAGVRRSEAASGSGGVGDTVTPGVRSRYPSGARDASFAA